MWRELDLEVKANFPPSQSAKNGRVVTKSQLFQDPSNNNESSGNNKQFENFHTCFTRNILSSPIFNQKKCFRMVALYSKKHTYLERK